MRIVPFIVTVLLLCGVALAQPSAPTDLPTPTLEDFLSDADMWSPEISPSGRFVSAGRRDHVGKKSFLIVADLGGDDLKIKATDMGDSFVNWVEWISDDKLLISLTGYINLKTGKPVSRQGLENLKKRDVVYPYTRIVSADREFKHVVTMFGESSAMLRNWSLGSVVSFLPNDPDHILMSARSGGDLDLFRVNVHDGTYTRIALGTDNTYAWIVDRDGEPAFRYNTNTRGSVIYIYTRENKTNGEIKWRKFKTIRVNRGRGTDEGKEFDPLYPGPTSTTFYVSARKDGADKAGIYLYDFEKDDYVETIREHPEVDLTAVVYNREAREIQGIVYFKDRLVLDFFDKNIQKHLNGLNAYFDNKANVYPVGSSSNGRIWLVRAQGPLDAGSYHVYDLDKRHADFIGSNYRSLEDKALGDVTLITYTARDGTPLKGYLTQPPVKSGTLPPPLIMMPHGGPEERDRITFNRDLQMLVSKGYQVFQPNFRGSGGYGQAFADLGRRQWGKRMQTDVDDALKHLVDTGIAAPDRACILGWSYGGYAALAAATLTPDLYQCAIGVAAPSDLVAMLNWVRKEFDGDSEEYDYWVKHIGDPKLDKDELYTVSPAALAGRVTRPILLMHGKDDGIVPIKQMQIMEAALKQAGKPFESVTLEKSGHSFRGEEDQRKEYEALIGFLSKHLPVEGPGER